MVFSFILTASENETFLTHSKQGQDTNQGKEKKKADYHSHPRSRRKNHIRVTPPEEIQFSLSINVVRFTVGK